MEKRNKILAVAATLILMAAGVRGVFMMSDKTPDENTTVKAQSNQNKNASVATFAGGCFWCIEEVFDKIPGVEKAVSGYMGGTVKNPTYEQVSTGTTGHREIVQVTYDPATITYPELVERFFESIDPTDAGGQFADRGSQYETAVFYHSGEQKEAAETVKNELAKSGIYKKSIATEILPASDFYPAETYHQDYSKKCPIQYGAYKRGSGRADYIDALQKKKKSEERKMNEAKKESQSQNKQERIKELTPIQREVTQACGTEPAFNNEYWDNKKEGIYVDIVSGEPLFSSIDKFDSGTGWPSFTQPLEPESVETSSDTSYGIVRTEARSKEGNSHLGHVFDDGPAPTGKRYCINSASLRFIPKEDLEKEGYGSYMKLFKGETTK